MATWPLSADGQYYVATGDLLLPVDPNGTAIIRVKPGTTFIAGGVTAIEQGPPGQPPTFENTVNFTALAYNDSTPASCSLTTITAPTDTTAGTYQLNVELHEGAPGTNGTTTVVPSDYSGSPVGGQMLVVNPTDITHFTLQSQKVGGLHLPANLYNTPPGNDKFTIGVISVAANTYDFDWRPDLEAQTVITGTGPNVLVNLVARLNGETGGNIVGYGFGLGGLQDRLVLADGPPKGSPDSWDVVPANAAATIYLRTEKQGGGSDSYTTSVDTTWFRMKVRPVP